MATGTESFDQPDSTTLGPDLVWTEVAGQWETIDGQAAMDQTSVNAYARAELDTGGPDMYVEATIPTTAALAAHYMDHQLLARMDATAHTGYALLRGYRTGTGAFYLLRRYSAGAETELTGNVALPLALPETWRLEVDGDTLTAYRNGVEIATVDDTTITTGQYAGLGGYKSTGNLTSKLIRFDSFETGQLGGAGEDKTTTATLHVNLNTEALDTKALPAAAALDLGLHLTSATTTTQDKTTTAALHLGLTTGAGPTKTAAAGADLELTLDQAGDVIAHQDDDHRVTTAALALTLAPSATPQKATELAGHLTVGVDATAAATRTSTASSTISLHLALAGTARIPNPARDIEVTLGPPHGHPWHPGPPTGHPLALAGLAGHPFTIGPPRRTP